MKTENSSGPNSKRWMLVDDDEGALSLMRQMVLKLGVTEIECFNNAKDALSAFKAAPGSFEMVITDFQMPRMDGIELSRKLLRLDPKIKILLMTGGNLIDDGAAADKGLCGLLRKPFQFETLQHALLAIAMGQFSTSSARMAAE
jgi:two-component system, cell cycle sensor histidine kinase and response regulator CckA